MSYRDLLPKRIPESLQSDNELNQYLEAAGELFDEFVAEIESFDDYFDPAKVAEKRLSQLAAQFAMNFPRNLNTELQRSIIRDLEAVYQKLGTRDMINWIFRLIGWDVSLEYAWVLNPERYDPEVKHMFSLDDYGREQMDNAITDFYSRDYRAFLLGEEIVFENGTYFRGRRFFDQRETFLKQEIVGEHYNERTKTRTPDKAMSTPYMFIRVSEEAYNIFISPYVDEDSGITYDYTEVEFFKVVENILNFFLFEEMRATHVRVVIIVTAQNLQDDFVVQDELTETWESDPVAVEDISVVADVEESVLHHELVVGTDFLSGAPPSPYNKDVVLSAIGYRNLVDATYTPYVDGYDRNYVIIREEDYPVARCGTDSFRFVTPHEDTFWFRRAYTSEQTAINPTSSGTTGIPYTDELAELALNFDLVTDTFGIIDQPGSQEIIVRNSTDVTSPNFNTETKPLDAFDIGNTIIDADTGEEIFDPNSVLAFDFRSGGELLANLDTKTYWYLYTVDVHYKTNNSQSFWDILTSNPTEGQLNNLTQANTLALNFAEQVPYDFILNIEYQAQPHWENRY